MYLAHVRPKTDVPLATPIFNCFERLEILCLKIFQYFTLTNVILISYNSLE